MNFLRINQSPMEPFGTPALLLATSSCTFMAVRAVRRGSLTPPAAVVGFVTGFLLVGAGLRGFLLFGFYLIASKATKHKATEKSKLSVECSSTTRGATQVVCASGVAVAVTLYHVLQYGPERPLGQLSPFCTASAITAHHATSLADTLASEMGILSGQQNAASPPRLITQPWRTVPRGCNGGVTVAGLVWSAVGGALIGSLTVLLDALSGILVHPVRIIVYCTLMGLLGSMLDSVLGATVQATYYDDVTHKIVHTGGSLLTGWDLLSNEQVNLVSTAVITLLGGYAVGPLIFSEK